MSTSVNCIRIDCNGTVESGICTKCKQPSCGLSPVAKTENREAIISSLRMLLEPTETLPSKEELIKASSELLRVVPYNFEAWRLHADLLINALRQILTRRLEQDEDCKILSIPLRENDLRDAAELALRQCAHYATDRDIRVLCVDEANSIRRLSWF